MTTDQIGTDNRIWFSLTADQARTDFGTICHMISGYVID